MDWERLLQIALVVSTIATLAGLGLLRGTVTNLREQLRDERDLTGSLRVRLTDAETDAHRMRGDLAALGRVVTGEAHWLAIGNQLDEHHLKAEQHWTAEQQLLADMRDLLRGQNP